MNGHNFEARARVIDSIVEGSRLLYEIESSPSCGSIFVKALHFANWSQTKGVMRQGSIFVFLSLAIAIQCSFSIQGIEKIWL